MNRFDELRRCAWSVLVTSVLAIAFVGCSSDGKNGAAGPTGPAGPPGPPGTGTVPPDPIAAAIDAAQIESCGTCHSGVGGGHQEIYDAYNDASKLDMTFTSFTTAPGAVAGTFDATLEFSITRSGAAFTDYQGLDQHSFYATRFDSATNQYLDGNTSLNDSVTMVSPGNYVITEAGLDFDPTVNGQVYGYIAQGSLFSHDEPTSELPVGSHVHLYDDVASTALAFGDAAAADPNAYVSAANVAGCENCHGSPYYKHGYRAAQVAGLPDFAACKSCHYDDRNGGHPDWQYMVDDPLAWATGQPAAADYSYTANIKNDVHMSHAMEFPYPQSMANCVTCHENKLATILDNDNFKAETCKSCHPIDGNNAWPGEDYNQPHRAPAFAYLWQKDSDLSFHFNLLTVGADCTGCHGDPNIQAPEFGDYHTGYDPRIYDAAGNKYADNYAVSIDNVSVAGNLLTIEFGASDPAIVPEVMVSFYGWRTKDFIVASHSRDGNSNRFEYVPESSGGSANALFTEDALSAPGSWIVTADFSAYVAGNTSDIMTLIADGTVTKLQVTVTPELTVTVGGEDIDVGLNATTRTFDLGSNMMVSNYFQDGGAIVDNEKCNACHDQLAVTFHEGSGRSGEITVCRNCHVSTSPGSHLEMQSRSIEGYVHAIHSFQAFDPGDTFEIFDPVLATRYDEHVKHTFPNFTIRNCEACHNPGTYNVPDQSRSMPGALSKSDDVATWYDMNDPSVENPAGRNIGGIPEYVVGPASKACGGCHRADMIAADAAGELASFNAHTQAFGTLVENDDNDEVLYGIIDKIMTWFE